VHDVVEPPVAGLDGGEQVVELGVVGDVAGVDGRVLPGDELLERGAQALALVAVAQRGAGGRERLGDRPGQAALVGHAHDEADGAGEVERVHVFLQSGCPHPVACGGAVALGTAFGSVSRRP
jgi:hypothetical protein